MEISSGRKFHKYTAFLNMSILNCISACYESVGDSESTSGGEKVVVPCLHLSSRDSFYFFAVQGHRLSSFLGQAGAGLQALL